MEETQERMIVISLIQKLKHQSLHGQWPTSNLSLSTDSRQADQTHFFIALVGEKFDAFQFVEQVIKQGCPLILFQFSEEKDKKAQELSKLHNVTFVGVSDSTKSLQELAHLRRYEWGQKGGKVIGVAGSNGKTTTKEILRSLLEHTGFSVCATEKNNNNHIGVPLTILSVKDSHQVLILEFGSNHPGEMEVLCRISEVDAGIITNIGDTHLEFFHNRENVLKEEAEIFFQMHKKSKGLIVLPIEDVLLATLKDDSLIHQVSNLEWSKKTIAFNFGKNHFELKNDQLEGRHNFVNLAMATSLAQTLWPSMKEEILLSAQEVSLPKNNRSEFIHLENTTIFLDAYNANPSSMRAALELFNHWCAEKAIPFEKRCYILGDMYELGAKEESYHQEMGAELKNMKAVHCYFVGKFSQAYNRGFGQGHCFSHPDDLKPQMNDLKSKFSAFFIKGSRGIKLESLLTNEERSHSGH